MPHKSSIPPETWTKKKGKDSSIQGSEVIKTPPQSNLVVKLDRIIGRHEAVITTPAQKKSSIRVSFWRVKWENILDKPPAFPPTGHGRGVHSHDLIPDTPPTTPQVNDIWFTSGNLYIRDNTAIREVITTKHQASSPPPNIAETSQTGTSTNFAREDHTHAGVGKLNTLTGEVTIAGGTGIQVDTNPITKVITITNTGGGGGGGGSELGAGSVLNEIIDVGTTGTKVLKRIESEVGIGEWELYLLGDPPSNANLQLDLLQSTYDNYPNMTSLIGSGTPPSISNNVKAQGVASSWRRPFLEKGDILAIKVASSTAQGKALLALKLSQLQRQVPVSRIVVSDTVIVNSIEPIVVPVASQIAVIDSVVTTIYNPIVVTPTSQINVSDTVLTQLSGGGYPNMPPSGYTVYNQNGNVITADLSVLWDYNTGTTFSIYYTPSAPNNPRRFVLWWEFPIAISQFSVYFSSWTTGKTLQVNLYNEIGELVWSGSVTPTTGWVTVNLGTTYYIMSAEFQPDTNVLGYITLAEINM